MTVPQVLKVSSVRDFFIRSWLYFLFSLNFLRCGLALDVADEAVQLTDRVVQACSLL